VAIGDPAYQGVHVGYSADLNLQGEIPMNWTVDVDISKAKLDVALLKADDKYRSKVFPNNEAGFIQLLQWIQANVPLGGAGVQVHVCMEATGSYHEALALFLFDHCLWGAQVR
jgi:hypothetical protein